MATASGAKQWINGQWIDLTSKEQQVQVYKNGAWMPSGTQDGVKIFARNAGKWVQKFPKNMFWKEVIFKGTGMAYTNNVASVWQFGHVKAGKWEQYDLYTGWTGITTKAFADRGKVAEVLEVSALYNRQGAGYWENSLKIPLCQSTLSGASGTGANAHASKRGSTALSDEGMLPLPTGGEDKYIKGTVTFNNDSARAAIQAWMNSTNALVTGFTWSGGSMICLNQLELTIKYTVNATLTYIPAKELPNTAEYAQARETGEMFEFYVYDDEINMRFTEIIERRKRLGIENLDKKTVYLSEKAANDKI